MTGGEIAAGKAIVDQAMKRFQEDKETRKQLQRIAEEHNLLGPAAEAYAKRLAIKQQILLKLYQPLAKLIGVSREYFENDFGVDMAAKTADIPDDDLVSPPPSVAIPAMEGLRYSLDSPNLKEMYLHLLATASDGRRPGEAHPSFAEVIRQLSPEEALLLKDMLLSANVPAVRLKEHWVKTGRFAIVANHLCNWMEPSNQTQLVMPLAEMYVDNWVRLGLVEASYDSWLVSEGLYDWVEQRPELIALRAELAAKPYADNDEDGIVEAGFDRGILRRTAFGARFAAAVAIGRIEQTP